MSQIHLPDALVKEIEASGFAGGALDEFVQQAIRDKLAIAKLSVEERRSTFYRLSDEMRTAMQEQVLTEEQLLTEFDARRRSS